MRVDGSVPLTLPDIRSRGYLGILPLRNFNISCKSGSKSVHLLRSDKCVTEGSALRFKVSVSFYEQNFSRLRKLFRHSKLYLNNSD